MALIINFITLIIYNLIFNLVCTLIFFKIDGLLIQVFLFDNFISLIKKFTIKIHLKNFNHYYII